MPGTSSSAPASTACPRPGTWPGSYGARHRQWRGRPGGRQDRCAGRARRASPAARSATTTSSPRCASSWPTTWRCGSPTPKRSPTIRSASCRPRPRPCTPTSRADLREQQAIGYDSVLVEGERDCRAYMPGMFPDWQATGATTVLHEKQGGYANNRRSLEGLAAKARAAGRPDRGRHPGDRPAAVRRRGHRGRDGPRDHRLRHARRRGRAVGP